MKRPSRHDDGFYHIDGNKFKILIGSRQQVWNRTAYKTAGELCHSDLMMNKWGRIVSKKKHATAKREKRLQKHGFFAKKGKFGFVKRTVRFNSAKKHSKSARRGRRGGDPPVTPPEGTPVKQQGTPVTPAPSPVGTLPKP
jgi:hypothetical protein